YQSQLSHLLSIRARYEKRGSGLSDDEVRIKWEDVKSAFLCRIQTGQIVNFKHKDATAFLEDAFTIFEERIKETLAEHSMIKVNVELAAEYMTVNKDGEVIFGDKYFILKMSIYRDQRTWENGLPRTSRVHSQANGRVCRGRLRLDFEQNTAFIS
ncbi:unnamed protein product, partial [Trichogramma brassicae]